ncbi:MAG: 50S ribosomal protein L18 [Patescibacteria group bacterium]
MNIKIKRKNKIRRHKRVRALVKGTQVRPRLSVFRSNKRIYAQLIDDSRGTILLSVSDIKTSASKVGENLAKKAIEKGIDSVVFDRGGYKYHGRVKALAEGARQGGLKF